MSPLPQSLRVPVAMGSAAEVFYTDFEGTDGRRPSSRHAARQLRTRRGVRRGALNGRIDAFNAQYAGTLTAAGRSLVTAGLFTRRSSRPSAR